MRYSVRQQHCLQSMGVVPWVSRFSDDAIKAETVETVETVEVAPDVQPEAEPVMAATQSAVAPDSSRPEASQTAVPQAAPQTVAELGEWLLAQSLAPIEYRGAMHPVLGVAEAPLLVVLSPANATQSAGSMTGDDGRLFDLMLRSIALTNRDTRRCLLAGQSAGAGADARTGGVGSLCTPQTRGVLLIMDDWTFDVADVALEHHQGRLSDSGLPIWRTAHPSVMLQQPQLKRQAWNVLKGIRAMLDGMALR